MHQVHTLSEGRKTQGQHQHKFPQTCIKFTHCLRAGKHKDSISTSFHRYPSSSHTLWGQENPRTASAHIPTDMHQVHTLSEGRKTQGQHQHMFHRHASSSHTN